MTEGCFCWFTPTFNLYFREDNPPSVFELFVISNHIMLLFLSSLFTWTYSGPDTAKHLSPLREHQLYICLVSTVGLEPTRHKAQDFKSRMSTSSNMRSLFSQDNPNNPHHIITENRLEFPLSLDNLLIG